MKKKKKKEDEYEKKDKSNGPRCLLMEANNFQETNKIDEEK